MKQICVRNAWLNEHYVQGKSELRLKDKPGLLIDLDHITDADIDRVAEWAGEDGFEIAPFGAIGVRLVSR
ncbi:hypothetical protein [Pseudomonas sp. MWU318]|uniref:hypothetical protein n=1 Tax=Pseudomonas sp. MWU318 TaxID=2802569 RepID=UPI0019268DDF|nr:hypothetical protein [Pseudomonas sp. MWU318]